MVQTLPPVPTTAPLNVVPEFKRVLHRARNLLNLSPAICRPSNPISPFLFSCTK